MNWAAIQKAWEAGNHEVAVSLLTSMLAEMRYRQAGLGAFLSRGCGPAMEVKA
jgi:hypothetical protein